MVEFKDINELTEESNIAGTGKVPVSGTKYVLLDKIKDWIINSLKTTGLDLGGKGVKNVAIDVVTSLPTTNLFVGRQVTYQGRSYIWDGSAWKCDSDYLEIGGRNLIKNTEVLEMSTESIDTGYYSFTLKSNKGDYPSLFIIKHDPSVSSYTLSYKTDTDNLSVTRVYYWSEKPTNNHISGRLGWEANFKSGSQLTIPNDPNIKYIGVGINGLSLNSEDELPMNFWDWKLEKGNIPTDWTPAPEDKANENQTINFDTNNIEPTQAGNVTKTSTWLWQYLVQSINWLRTTLANHNHDTTYLGITDTATNSNMLDGKEASEFASVDHDHDAYLELTGGAMSGNLDMGGKEVKNVAIEVVTSLPTTDIVGRQVTYQGRSYIWDGSAWKNDYVDIGGRNLISSLPINWQQGSFVTGTLGIVYYKSRILIVDIKVSPNTQYTLSLKDGYEVWIPELDETKTGVARTSAVFWSNKTFTTTSNTEYLYVSIRKTGAAHNSTNPDDFISPSDITDVNIKLEKGNIPTDWTPASEDKADVDHNHDTTYLGITEKAADSEKLDGIDSTGFAQLEDGKIKATNLPDYLLGQVLYGGSINSSQVCTFSLLYKDKFDTTAATGALGNPLSHVGVYFIASGSFTLNGTIDIEVGDWVISDGNAWGKIDNTDAVASVNGKKGVVNLSYDDIGDIPMASDERIGGIMLGDVVDGLNADLLDNKHASDFATSEQGDLADSSLQPEMINDLSNDYLPKWDDSNNKFINSLISDDGSTPKYGANKIWHSGNIAGDDIKDVLGLVGYNNYNKQDIFISGLSTPIAPDNYFNNIKNIGSYRVSGAYYNAPNPDCGTSASNTGSMKGSLNVFRSGVNNWELIQQLFWVLNGKTEQYQRSYDGTTWTVWKRLIKCDDYATIGKGGIISAANFGELFRAPGLIQLWNEADLPLSSDTYFLDNLSIGVQIENSIELDGSNRDIIGLDSERRYRVTYEVHYEKVEEGEGEVTIRIEDGGGELYSITDYISDWETRKSTAFSVILTNIDFITPSIEVGGLNIIIHPHYYQVSVEEIKIPLFTPNPV